MNYAEIAQHMLKAKEAAQQSLCGRRKIGAIIPAGSDETVWGWNNPGSTLHCCGREAGICPAVHAEVMAVSNLSEAQRRVCSTIFVWCEVPCHSCLSYLQRHSGIRKVYCLSPDSYAAEYPRVQNRTGEIIYRRQYAKDLGITIAELDREEILEYVLRREPVE